MVVYRLDAISAWIARKVLQFHPPYVSLVNLILEEKVRGHITGMFFVLSGIDRAGGSNESVVVVFVDSSHIVLQYFFVIYNF